MSLLVLHHQLTHRPVNGADLPVLCGFPRGEEELFFLSPQATYPLTPKQLEQAIAQRAESTVVELEGRVVAFANFYRWEPEGSCSIGNVMVAPDARKRGVGRYLIERMVERAREKYQAREVRVSCFNCNTAGLLFYPKLGFQPYAVEERTDRQGSRVALLHLRLLLDTA